MTFTTDLINSVHTMLLNYFGKNTANKFLEHVAFKIEMKQISTLQ